MKERRFRLVRLKYVDKGRAYYRQWTNFSLHCTVATDANITDAPVPPGGDTVRKINMATSEVSQLVFEYLIALTDLRSSSELSLRARSMLRICQ